MSTILCECEIEHGTKMCANYHGNSDIIPAILCLMIGVLLVIESLLSGSVFTGLVYCPTLTQFVHYVHVHVHYVMYMYMCTASPTHGQGVTLAHV